MRSIYPLLMQGANNSYGQWFRAILNSLIFISIISCLDSTSAHSQGVIPTKGVDFWIGVPFHEPFSTKRCDVFITSDVNTSGIISIPAQGWSQNFVVTANVTTTLTLPLAQAENVGSEIIQNRGVQILSNDTVNVFAVVIQQYSADASVVYPKSTLGTDYRITSYRGLQNSNYPNLKSQFQIVATEDGTQIQITPSVTTLSGRLANVPFQVNLNKGQSYQVMAAAATGDFTGTKIIGTDSSGSCRPFAVFSGTNCANVPNACGACDILYDQALPVKAWGKTYHVVPFGNTPYTLKVLAEKNGTTFTIDGVTNILNAGQFIELNQIIGTRCIQSNNPISVTQFMQGNNCGGSGDPSMMYLNAEEQKIDQVTFSTVTSTIITVHKVNVIMKSTHINQLKLDGVNVPSSSFTTMNYCNSISYASLNLTPGSHTLSSDSGFTGYVYGTGGYESYAYSVGSFSKSQPIQLDSILCTTDTVQIGSPLPMFGPWWSTVTNPNDTIHVGPVLTLVPPIVPDIYVLHGNEFISGCVSEFYFDVTVPTPPQIWTAQTSTTACIGQLVQLNAGTTPASSSFQYQWSPVVDLSNAFIPNPVLTASVSGWYVVKVTSINGCTPAVFDSVYVNVYSSPLPVVSAGPDRQICFGDSINITATGGVSYVWNSGAMGASVYFAPTITSNFIVFATDTNGCGNSDTVTIKVNTLPIANAGLDRSICQKSTTTLFATGGVNYSWIPGNLLGNNIVVTPLSTTMYTVEVTDINGCKNKDSVLITVNLIAPANAGPDQHICLGDTALLSASGGTSYLWQPGGTTVNPILVSPTTSTNYVVMVNNASNCFTRDTVRVFVHALPAVNAGLNQQICIGDSAQLSVIGGLSCMWFPGGDSSRTITVFPTGTTNYLAIVTDTLGCQKADSVTVVVNALPNVNLGADVSLCYNDSVLLSSPITGQSYLWSPTGSVSKDIMVAPLTNTAYVLTLTDFNSCVNRDTVQVIVHPEVIADAGPSS
ncbi:MAG: IgGFc-binding protein [Bacteroidetes bacterium]|nr:IgGFc-binding protein [Bacteroidota bacterium]